MAQRVIEVMQHGTSLNLVRGSMLIENDKGTFKVPLDNISILILSNAGVVISTNLMSKLVEDGVCIMLLSASYEPLSLIASPTLHTHHHARVQLQINMSEPLKKNIWKRIIQIKIKHQKQVLAHYARRNVETLDALSKAVKSGDPENTEGRAARIYWKSLMGEDFLRQTKAEGSNGMLNYGYAILRSSVARALVARGLSPTLGVFHKNKQNPFCLVDDLMEPFRPIVDAKVVSLLQDGYEDVNPEVKKELSGILSYELEMENKISPVSTAILELVDSYYNSLVNKKETLVFPKQGLPFGGVL